MAGQNPSRRELLEALALASMAAFAPGFQRWALASQMSSQTAMHHATSPVVAPPAGRYVPVFFKPREYATVEQLADLILPPDGDAPGAKAAGVAEFIDFIVAQDVSLQQPFVDGLTAMDRASQRLGSADFLGLHETQQTNLLGRLAYRKRFEPGDDAARKCFALVRKYVVIGFYTSEAGFKALDSPFLTFYSESPGCAHPEGFHAGKEAHPA